MITLHHFRVEEIVMSQICSYFANNAIAVSQIVVLAKYITVELELIAVAKIQRISHNSLQVNVGIIMKERRYKKKTTNTNGCCHLH
jgi:hypothetical protein